MGLEQQAELMLKMMATLEADAILQALTSTSPSGTHTKACVQGSYCKGKSGNIKEIVFVYYLCIISSIVKVVNLFKKILNSV